jgi:proline iminopeptidase
MRHLSLASIAAGAVLSLAACTGSTPKGAASRPTEGFIQVEGGKVWYHIEGADKPGTPLLLLHGGPGSTSFGLKPLEALAVDRPVIRYDQLGCGKSDHPTDTSLFTVDRFVRELQTVRDALGLTDVDMMGHSWGAMLAEAYMGTNPKGVRRLILSSPLVTTAQWTHDADSLIKLLPDSVQHVIAREEAAKTTDSPAYNAAMDVYYAEHVRRAPKARPADSDSSGQLTGKLVYNYMWGPSEFTSTGTLKTFDATAWLKGITIPTLFLAGEFDEATPASTERFSRLVSQSRFVMIPNSGHATANDNLPALLDAVRTFLK